MTVTFGTSNAVQMMSDVLAGLSGATVTINGPSSNTLATFTLSTSPGQVMADGSLLLFHSTSSIIASVNDRAAFVKIGTMENIPVVSSPVAMVSVSSPSTAFNFVFSGARIPFPVASSDAPVIF